MKLWPDLAVLIIATHQQGCTHADIPVKISTSCFHYTSFHLSVSGWLMFEKDRRAPCTDIWQHRLHIGKKPVGRLLVLWCKAGRRHRWWAQLLLLVPNRISATSCIKVFKLIPAASSRLPFQALHPISVVSWSRQQQMGVISSTREPRLCFLLHR